MENTDSLLKITVIWRGNKYIVEMNPDASVKNLGDELQKLTNVKPDTMRLIVPKISYKGSQLLSPFSNEHSQLSLQKASIIEGKSIRMMGVSEDEVDKVLQNAKVDLRIAGFDEEEKRMRQRTTYRFQASPKLPQGPYIFCDFRTLQIPGMELKPPASEALKRMHMLAADPGIVAIMNKHRWRVGIMTEMAPVGYVGVSPKCILGLNKNHGEEISLRLRTDDLKGFRKYESIKKTLLHELAHMVYSEHDANFYALDKQLNQEAVSFNWTKSGGHTLSGIRHLDDYEESNSSDNRSFSLKLGGNASDQLASARASSVTAAYQRLAYNNSGVHDEPDPDDLVAEQRNLGDGNIHKAVSGVRTDQGMIIDESDLNSQSISGVRIDGGMIFDEPDPDESEAKQSSSGDGNIHEQDQNKAYREPDPDESQVNRLVQEEPDPVDALVSSQASSMAIDEPDPDDQELQRIQDPVTVVCGRLQKAVETLRAEVNPTEAIAAFQTLFKIIRNVIEHPNEMKFKRLRKANPIIQKNVANHRAAMEILLVAGFSEDVVFDATGKPETYLVLKRNDPGLLWLVKSSLETYVAC
ncbi:uncharacterized protein LOC8265583 isoform X2 [Ricinus communis]|uniref:uncharacterized protein LOC8265583 isoform X2 n=1 Tax=Ricinus communis TaxID=3988 RepID=UPI00201A9377|nr:uncharacterized protein LOC8265583 isoform X2 [Ricinus communis]